MSYPGWIERGRGLDPIPCQIQDVSEEGDAKLAVENADLLPDKSQLCFSLTSQPGRHCVVRQRLPDGVGVQFVRFLKDENAATAIEYGLIATGIAVAVLPVITGLGTHLKSTFTTISSALK
jgi:pilus assembly protein Flp/PilA